MTYRKMGLSLIAAAVFSLPASAQVLRTGVDATFPPHAMRTLSGGLQGFNIDLGQEIARRLGKKIEIDGTEFSGLVPGLNAGKYDFILAPVTATPERAKQMLFSEGYLDTGYVFVEKKSAPGIKSFADLKGKTIGVNKGSAYEHWARENAEKHGFKFDVYGTTADAVQAVQAGRGDAVLAASGVSAWIAKQNPQVKTSFSISTGLVWALAFRADDKTGRDTVSMALKCMKKDGFIAKNAEKWFGIRPDAKDSAVVIAEGQGIPGLAGYDPTPAPLKC